MKQPTTFAYRVMHPDGNDAVAPAVPVKTVGRWSSGFVIAPKGHGYGFIDRLCHSKTIIKPENTPRQLG